MLRNLSKKLRAKFALTILGCSLVRIPCLNGALWGIHELEAIPVDGQQVLQKDVKRRKSKREKTKTKPKGLKMFNFCFQNSLNKPKQKSPKAQC